MKFFTNRSFYILLLFAICHLFYSCDKPTNRGVNKHAFDNNSNNNDYLNQLYFKADSIKFLDPDSASKLMLVILNTNSTDSTLIGNCYKLLGVTYILRSDLDSATIYLERALDLAKHSNDSALMASSFQNIGTVAIYKGDYLGAKGYYIMAASLFFKIEKMEDYSNSLVNFGTCFEYLGDMDSAMFYYQKGIDIKNEYHFTKSLHLSYSKLASLNYRIGNYEMSEFYFFEAINIQKKNKMDYQLCFSYSNLSALYLDWEKIHEALKYLYLAETLSIKLGVMNILANTYNNLGVAYFKLKNYDKSLLNLEKSLEYSRVAKINYIEAASFLNLGVLHHQTEGKGNSSAFFDSAYIKAVEMADLNLINKLYLEYSNYFYDEQNFEDAFFYLQKMNEIKDSIYRIDKIKTIEEFNTKYETEKKDLVIKQNTLQLRNQRITLYSVLVISFLILTGIIAAYKMRLNKLTANIELYKRNQELARLKAENKSLIKRNGLSDDKTADIIEKINQLFEIEKIYKSPDLSLTKIAEILNTNREYLSQIFNQTMGTKFSDYITSYRVEEAKILLDNEAKKKSHHLTMLAIANEVGYKNTSTFNPAFKKYTGLTPSEYKVAGERI
jgi:AraC-like DNA-binding protein/tetratricopeptide (TPR) repeat protein